MTTATTRQELNEVYNLVNMDFKVSVRFGSIHGLLWDIVINRINENDECTFYDVIEHGKRVLCRVFYNEMGYSSTGLEFEENITDKQANVICSILNENLFNQTEDDTDSIIASSFAKQIKVDGYIH